MEDKSFIDSPILMEAKNLGIRYNLHYTKSTTVRSSLKKTLMPWTVPSEYFWALKGIQLSLRKGECLGVIGPNGAGKSTLLQALAGIIEPSEGEVTSYGRVSSLLTLGVGFDVNLSGVENIKLAAAYMGIEKKRLEKRLEYIIDFAELGDFIHAPIKTYSSGMRARLGFSIATAFDPEILLLDEVLGTGDQSFRNKSKDRVKEIVTNAHAVVLVTHDLGWINEFCNYSILLERGNIIAEGAPAAVVEVHKRRSVKPREAYDCPGCIRPFPANRVFCHLCGLKLSQKRYLTDQ